MAKTETYILLGKHKDVDGRKYAAGDKIELTARQAAALVNKIRDPNAPDERAELQEKDAIIADLEDRLAKAEAKKGKGKGKSEDKPDKANGGDQGQPRS